MNILSPPVIRCDSYPQPLPGEARSTVSQEIARELYDPVPDSPVKTRIAVSEELYWQRYYEDSDHHYEWNNGYLEEKGVSDYATTLVYKWFFQLLDQYLTTYPIAQTLMLEMGVRLVLPTKVQIRKPDLGVIRLDNPVILRDLDQSYRGVCDLCVEALSTSTPDDIERDTVTKFNEYARAGVKEYYILYAHGEPMAFYRLSKGGVYRPIKPKKDVIQSQVLPGFQFRRADLSRRPSVKEMSQDKLYRGFVGRDLQEERQKTKAERQRADAESQKAEAERQRAEVESQRAQQAEAKVKQLEAELARRRH